ncbi:MAG: hypothetical protein AB7F31_01190 [Parachlamydiales bacterium]
MQAKIVGHIDHVLMGRVTKELKERWLDASAFLAAFEIGSPESMESLGETVVLNGTAYTQSTKTHQLIYGPRLLTTGLFILPKGSQPTATLTGGGLTAADLYKLGYQKAGGPFAYTGLITFDQLEATFITAPPIHNEAIFDHKERYYALPPIHQKGGYAAIVGVATDFSAPYPLNKKLTSVLYKNPFEPLTEPSSPEGIGSGRSSAANPSSPGFTNPASSRWATSDHPLPPPRDDRSQSRVQPPGTLSAHSHILLLKNSVTSIAAITPEMAHSVLHLFPQSTLSAYQLALYPLTDLVDF